MKNTFWLGLALPLLTLAVGCNAPQTDLSQRKVRVVTTTGMITDAVQRVGGERVELSGLMGPGVDPHLYKATAGDVGRMGGADLVFYNGLHLEGQMSEVFERMRGRTRTAAVAEALDSQRDLRKAPEGFEGAYDPHVWFDVTLWSKVVGHIRDKLAEADPTHAEAYRQNAAKYLAELEELHEYVTVQAKKVPPKQRVLITAHDAFYYFGQRYGFQVHSLQGVSTAAEASVADVQRLADFIATNKVPAIFVESSVPVKNIEAVQKAVEKKGFSVKTGGELHSDALGDPDTPEGTYVGMVRHNIDTIVKALAP